MLFPSLRGFLSLTLGSALKPFTCPFPSKSFSLLVFLASVVRWWAFCIVILWFYNLFIMHYCASKQYECLCKWGHFINKWSYLLLLIKEAAHNAPGAPIRLRKFVNWISDLTRLTTAANSRISLFMPINALRGFNNRSWWWEQKALRYNIPHNLESERGHGSRWHKWQQAAVTFDLISGFLWTQNYLSEVCLDVGSLQCHILATYWGVWVTVKAVQAKFTGCSFDGICEQASEVNDLALKRSNSYLHH